MSYNRKLTCSAHSCDADSSYIDIKRYLLFGVHVIPITGFPFRGSLCRVRSQHPVGLWLFLITLLLS